MRVLVVENMPHSKLGQVGVALAEAGAGIVLCRPYLGETLPDDETGFDALVVFGGEQSAIDDELHPYLPDLARLMRVFTEADKAVLGICLGSQLLARGYGAQNLLNRTREFGWHGIDLTEEGRVDPVLSAAGNAFKVFEWHSDTFTLPPEAVHLANSPAVAHQAFRVGRAGYGMQFHFEASTEVVTEWNDIFRHQIVERDGQWLADYATHVATDGPLADDAGLALARAWVRQIRAEAEDAPLQVLAG